MSRSTIGVTSCKLAPAAARLGARAGWCRYRRASRPGAWLRQRYREGQEDQLDTLGLVLMNTVVLRNIGYLDAVMAQLHQE